MKVLLLRHAPTAGNLKKCYVGVTDEPLCLQGAALARALGQDETLPRAYVSPMLRARQTAALWYPNARLITVDGLTEMNFGAFEGRTYKELQSDPVYQAWLATRCEGPCPGGEDMAEFSRRTAAAFERAVHGAAERGEHTAVFVAHGGTVMAVMHALDPDGGYFERRVEPCEGYRLDLHPSPALCLRAFEKAKGGAPC